MSKNNKTESPKKSKPKGKLTAFFTDERFKITLGLALTGMGVVMFIAFVSYFFTWEHDHGRLFTGARVEN